MRVLSIRCLLSHFPLTSKSPPAPPINSEQRIKRRYSIRVAQPKCTLDVVRRVVECGAEYNVGTDGCDTDGRGRPINSGRGEIGWLRETTTEERENTRRHEPTPIMCPASDRLCIHSSFQFIRHLLDSVRRPFLSVAASAASIPPPPPPPSSHSNLPNSPFSLALLMMGQRRGR